MPKVEELFEPYGPAVVAEVLKQIRRSGTIGPLLRQLGMDAPRRIEDQYDVLLAYVEENGAVGFLNAVSLSDAAGSGSRRIGSRTGTSPGAQRPTPANPRPAAQQAAPAEQQAAAAPAPEAGHAAAAGGGTYTGPDRRSGGPDRRQGPADRRASVDLIFRNRRFGGPERRKIKRRAEDRAKG